MIINSKQTAETKFKQTFDKLKSENNESLISIQYDVTDDGAVFIDEDLSHGFQVGGINKSIDLNKPRELIASYRKNALESEIARVVEEIVNESIIINDDSQSNVELSLDKIDDLTENTKKKIKEEFDNILRIIDFKNKGQDLFRKWYIDGKLALFKIYGTNTKDGIKDAIVLDPSNLLLIKKFQRLNNITDDFDLIDISKQNEFFIYSKTPLNNISLSNIDGISNSVTIPREMIAFTTSGITDKTTGNVLSFLHPSIKYLNNLKLIEDAIVIYRVSRAPERRMFYVDVGSLQAKSALQYINSVAASFKTNIAYNPIDGSIDASSSLLNFTEDYILPRREGGRGTEVTTLPSGDNLGKLEDLEYIKDKLFSTLYVPKGRFTEDGGGFNIGRSTEITRDEIRFTRFIKTLRSKFSNIFLDLLGTNLAHKGILGTDDFNRYKSDFEFVYENDNYFQELKLSEIMNDRIELLSGLMQNELIGTYFSRDFVFRNILKFSDDEIKEQKELMRKEKEEESKNDDNDDDNNDFGNDKVKTQNKINNNYNDKKDKTDEKNDVVDGENNKEKVNNGK